jgi:recombination protein RecA
MAKREKSGLEDVFRQIEKQYGVGSVSFYSQMKHQDADVFSTGSIGLDLATGIGGWPRGRMIELYGQESSGKTTLALHAIANAQQFGPCAFIDMEHALDPGYAANLGVDMDRLIVSQPDYGEQALNIAERLVETGEVVCLVIDSVAALIPRAELEGEIGDQTIGLQARMMSQTCRKLSPKIAKNNVAFIFINQLREKVNMMGFGGNPYQTTGGNSIKFYASMRTEIKFIGQHKVGDSHIANKVVARVVKNKLAPPFRQAEFMLRFGQGIDYISELMECAIDLKVIKQAGSWFSIKDKQIGQGKEAARTWLEEHPAIVEKIHSHILSSQ